MWILRAILSEENKTNGYNIVLSRYNPIALLYGERPVFNGVRRTESMSVRRVRSSVIELRTHKCIMISYSRRIRAYRHGPSIRTGIERHYRRSRNPFVFNHTHNRRPDYLKIVTRTPRRHRSSAIGCGVKIDVCVCVYIRMPPHHNIKANGYF